MSSDAPFQLHILFLQLLNAIFDQFSLNSCPSAPPKSSFSFERVVDFKVFRTFLSTTLLNPFRSQFWTIWTSFWELLGPFWAPLDASWGVLRSLLAPSSILLPQKPVLRTLLNPQSAPRAPKIDQNRPKSTALAAHWSSKIDENPQKSTKINENQ